MSEKFENFLNRTENVPSKEIDIREHNESQESNSNDPGTIAWLDNLIEKRSADFKMTYETIKRDREKVIERDKIVERLTNRPGLISRFVRRYCLDKEIVIREQERGDLCEVELGGETLENIPELPEGYVYSGGAMRSALMRVLGVDRGSEPRDLDICYAGENEDKELSEELAEKYMPDDYSHGHGVEPADEKYFDTRDFTINEGLLLGDKSKIICTKRCLLDTMRGIVRLTEWSKDESYYRDNPYFVHSQVLGKALRFLALDELRRIEFANEEIFFHQDIVDFFMALNLDKSLGQGRGVAERYMEELRKRDLLPRDIDNIRSAVEYFKDKLDSFVFQNSKFPNSEKELDKWYEKYDEYDDILPAHEGMGKRNS